MEASNYKMKNEIGLVMVLAMIICLSIMPTSVQSVNVATVVTPAFFTSIIKQSPFSCEGTFLYTRTPFLSAVRTFPRFANGTLLIAMREIAAFFAHATYETSHFCIINEIGADHKPYCDRSCRKKYPCLAPSYHGRGPLQLTGNCNYGECAKDLGIDLLNQPELASSLGSVSFKTALWYWMKRAHPVMNKGFGATIRAIKGGECNGKKPAAVRKRVKYYTQYCKMFQITPGPNLTC